MLRSVIRSKRLVNERVSDCRGGERGLKARVGLIGSFARPIEGPFGVLPRGNLMVRNGPIVTIDLGKANDSCLRIAPVSWRQLERPHLPIAAAAMPQHHRRLTAYHVRNAATANGRKSSSPAAIRTKTSGHNGVIKYGGFGLGQKCLSFVHGHPRELPAITFRLLAAGTTLSQPQQRDRP